LGSGRAVGCFGGRDWICTKTEQNAAPEQTAERAGMRGV
jgi:hypothetical protein